MWTTKGKRIMKLPTFKEVSAKMDQDIELNPLEYIIWENEPTENDDVFRHGLKQLIEFVGKGKIL